MAEVAGLVASIAQVASAGVRLSSALYDAASGVARAEQELAAIADHVKTTAIALDRVGSMIGQEEGAHDVSKPALSEARDLATRCEAVFGDVQDFIERMNNLGRDGTKTSQAYEQTKEQRTEILKRRLDSLKHSILLLLHVLQLANAQAKGNVDNTLIAQERDTIRDLHQRQQESLKALHALESKLGDVFFSDDETLNGSAAPSRVPTINFMVHSSARGGSSNEKASVLDKSTAQAPSALGDKPETSGSDNSDETVTDDDEDLTLNELAHCANHAQKLSKRITALQQSCEAGKVHPNRRFPRNKILKLYRRFCRKFEAEMTVHESATPTVAPLPNVLFPYQHNPRVQPHETTRDTQPPNQQSSRFLPDPSGTAADKFAHGQTHPQIQQNNPRTARPAAEVQYAPAAPAWTISSEPLGPGRPKLPPLISSIPGVPRASHASPTNELMSPADDHDAKHSGTDGDAEHGSYETGPVVYTKTGRVSKAKKGLKVHVCEECGRSFTRAEHLRRHQKNHGPNQVRCELCGKVFFRADLLQRHLERHKDLPQGYRFSNAPGSSVEGASPGAADDQHHRHILPAPGNAAPGIPPHHSPSGRSVTSSGASGAPTPSEAPAASPAATSRSQSGWDTTRNQPVAPYAQDEKTSQLPHAWQSVNAQERKHFDTGHAHASSPSLQQSHPGLPKLQPKPDAANGASVHKRYSNILPAPGATNTQNQNTAYPQEHTPNMLSTHRQVTPMQATSKATASPAAHEEHHRVSQSQFATGPRLSPLRQDKNIGPRSSVASTASAPGHGAHSDHNHIPRGLPSMVPGHSFAGTPNGPVSNEDGHPSNTAIESGKISSDKDGVNWRLAETESQSYRKRKHYRTVTQTDGECGEIDDHGNGHAAHRTPDVLARSRSGSRSLSLVTPQDDRDHALLGTSRPEHRQPAELILPHSGPHTTALSERRSTSRPSTGVSETANIQATKAVGGPESPEPESPYSLATINRYIQNQGPQPGVQDIRTGSVSPQISINPCERCSQYSIRCDGKIPSCTACATTKYAGECSFAQPKFYENISAMTRHAMAEPQGHSLQPPVAGNYQQSQDYNSEEDLPSPYLKPRDKGQHTVHIPSASLDVNPETQPSRKRKADGAQQDGVEVGTSHERKKSKGEHTEAAKGKDIVDLLLNEWTVPVS